MTTVSPGRSTPNRRRAHAALGSAAAAMVGVATVAVGAQLIGVTPPAGDTSPSCAEAYQCLQPGADPLISHGHDPLVSYGPAIWNSGMPSGLVAGTHTGGTA
jgi:hypothetical protein